MQTKSRYEVVADLEEQKRNLIRERDSLDKVLLSKKKDLKELKREIEDKEEEITEFESSMEDSKKTIQTLIESVNESLNRFSEIGEKKS
jgi:chromosome segregation ATPase